LIAVKDNDTAWVGFLTFKWHLDIDKLDVKTAWQPKVNVLGWAQLKMMSHIVDLEVRRSQNPRLLLSAINQSWQPFASMPIALLREDKMHLNQTAQMHFLG
jgi:hypothetical protein